MHASNELSLRALGNRPVFLFGFGEIKSKRLICAFLFGVVGNRFTLLSIFKELRVGETGLEGDTCDP